MFNKFPVLRRVSIYMVLSYGGLVLVNNSGYQLENMWVIYAPMFIGVYIFSRWIDSNLSEKGWSLNRTNPYGSPPIAISKARAVFRGQEREGRDLWGVGTPGVFSFAHLREETPFWNPASEWSHEARDPPTGWRQVVRRNLGTRFTYTPGRWFPPYPLRSKAQQKLPNKNPRAAANAT